MRDVADFPRPGIVFKDITPLLVDGPAFGATIDALVGLANHLSEGAARVDKVVGIEARGFIFAAPLALALGAGFVPVRKAGKLPWQTDAEEYVLEYGADQLEMHQDGVIAGERVLIVDDVLATGGTAAATARLVERAGGIVAGLVFVIELGFLDGRPRLGDNKVVSLLTYD